MPEQLSFFDEAARAIQLEASPLADKILRAARLAGGSEEQLIMSCDSLLADFATRLGMRWEPRGERSVAWIDSGKRKHGRIDRLFDRLVVEYERPGCLSQSNHSPSNQHAIGQVRGYIDALVSNEGWKEKSVAGVVTDGYRFIYCRYSHGQWIQEAPLETGAASVSRFLRLLLTFQRPPLLPDALLARFGADSDITLGAVSALYECLSGSPLPLTQALLRQWQDFFADIAGLSPEALAQKQDLVRFATRIVGKEEPDPALLLFALYTYSALLTKLLAVLAVTPFFASDDSDRIATWAALPTEDLRSRLREVESGEFFRRVGIANFTEGDFFGWYCAEWTPYIASSIQAVLTALSEYDPDTVEQAPEQVRDLLKRLYHGLFPRAVRHDLGEYYTPDWLAERLLSQVDHDLFGPIAASDAERAIQSARIKDRLTSTRFIDPACGSGTFLVLILRRLRQWARECGVSERDALLPAIATERNVMGFDLNPLAVISARANYLLAIGDLLRPGDDLIEIPIYLADSIVLPARGNGEGLFDEEANNYLLPLRGVGEVFTVPEQLADPQRLSLLATLLRRDVEQEVGRRGFVMAAERLLNVTGRQYHRIKDTLGSLYDTLLRLHKEGRNGLWADIARNMFMPLFVKPADFVVGNPPWVLWDSLPVEYRNRSRDIWERYGLFPKLVGLENRLGKTKVDVAQLLTYVAADFYLRAGGTLGFILPQSVFKTGGGGRGFRRFRLGNGEPLQVLSVDDMSSFHPFEGASNRTVTAVFRKGRETRYPVEYHQWRKKKGPRIPFSATLDQATLHLEVTDEYASPIASGDITSPWLTGSPEVIRAIARMLRPGEYIAHAGAYSGGANAVLWPEIVRHHPDGTVTIANSNAGVKREIRTGRFEIESDLLYPLLRERNVHRWHAFTEPTVRFLCTWIPGTGGKALSVDDFQSSYPRTLAYLRNYEIELRERRDGGIRDYMRRGGAFYTAVIRPYHFSPYKVVWGNIASRIDACVVSSAAGKPVVPQHIVSMVATESADEAHYLCAMLNSTPFDLAVRSYSQEGGKSFGTPHVLENIGIPRYTPKNAVHQRLAELSAAAHSAVQDADPASRIPGIESEIDERAAEVWGLTSSELSAIRAAAGA